MGGHEDLNDDETDDCHVAFGLRDGVLDRDLRGVMMVMKKMLMDVTAAGSLPTVAVRLERPCRAGPSSRASRSNGMDCTGSIPTVAVVTVHTRSIAT